MGSYVIVLIAVIVYCNEIYCDALPTSVIEDNDLAKRHDNQVGDKRFFGENLGLSRHQPTKEETRSPTNTSGEMRARKSRLLSSLAFLAGLGFGGLATAASSSVKSIAKLPQTSLSLNLGDVKTSPHLAAYSLLPYPFLYPIKIVQTNSSNDLPVISVFNGQPIDRAEGNEDYADKEDKPGNDKSNAVLRADADRNAEEKIVIRGCKEGQRKFGGSLKGSSREREDPHVDADDLRASANAKQAANGSTTMTPPGPNVTYYPPYFPFPGYYGGYPQSVNQVDLTAGLNTYHYDHGQISYNPSYAQPAPFYHDDKYNVYPSTHPPPGPYYSEYQPPYSDGFRPVK